MKWNSFVLAGALSLIGINGTFAEEVECPPAKVPTPCVLDVKPGVARIIYLPGERISGKPALVDGLADIRTEWSADVMSFDHNKGGGGSTAIIVRAASPGFVNRMVVATDAGFREFVLRSVGSEKGSGH